MKLRTPAVILLLTAVLLSACSPGTGTVTPIPGTADLYGESPAPGSTAASPPASSTLPPAAPTQGAAAPLPEMVCTFVSTPPTPGPTPESLFPPVTDADWVRGDPAAPVTFLEYSDFQCPGCAGLAPVLDRLMEEMPGQVRVVFRHFPLLSIHPNAALAVQAAEAAGRQEKFWEMHDLLFAHQAEWNNLDLAAFREWLLARAAELELDAARFTADLESEELQRLAQEAWDWGVTTGIPHTPFLLINGEIYDGPVSYGQLDAIARLIQMEDMQFTFCPEMAIDLAKDYFATIHTEKGDIVLRLFPDRAPKAVNSFVFLIEQDWFDDVTFHRVLPGFVAQAGDPSGTGFGGPGYAFAIEVDPTLTFDRAGLLAMANSGPESNGSQFFITTGPAEHLNGGFTIFGEVVEGMDIVQSLAPRNPSPNVTLPPGDLILDITLDER
jgi:cyclophilin family peptidyl-prolyl cis-trans isomerase/protein-disulfide isomerase